MTDADQLVVWLREAMDAAEQGADRWHDVECDVHTTSLTDAAVLQSATLCDCGGPAAVLRRIDRDRKILDDCEVYSPDGMITASLAEHVIRNLAEGWGWTETRSWPDCMCTPSGECGNCWEKRQGARNVRAPEGEPR